MINILGLQPRDKAAMLVVNTIKVNKFFSRIIYMKTGFSPQRREMLLLLNLNHQHDITCKRAISFFHSP